MHVGFLLSRRRLVEACLTAAAATLGPLTSASADTFAQESGNQPVLSGKDYGKTAMTYSDFAKGEGGLLYKDGKLGKGRIPEKGDRCVVEWTGYTIGYFGRPFETKRLQELDAKDEDFLRFELGSGAVIPALEMGISGMAEGGVRQIIVPPNLGYPADDPDHSRVGPRPSTFSGQRALNFVLENKQLIDKTLLFNVKLIRVDPKGSRRG